MPHPANHQVPPVGYAPPVEKHWSRLSLLYVLSFIYPCVSHDLWAYTLEYSGPERMRRNYSRHWCDRLSLCARGPERTISFKCWITLAARDTVFLSSWDLRFSQQLLWGVLSSVLATCLHVGLMRGLFFNPEDGGDMFLWNVCWLSPDYMALYLLYSSYLLIPRFKLLQRRKKNGTSKSHSSLSDSRGLSVPEIQWAT
jgi:hypothetical protein